MLRLVELAGLRVDLGELGEEVVVRDPDVVEETRSQVQRNAREGCEGYSRASVVDGVVAGFRSNVTDRAARQRLASLQVPDRNDERMRAMTLAVRDELRHYDGMVGRSSETSDPPEPARQRMSVKGDVAAYHFEAVNEGELMTNSWASLSYVAVVSRPWTLLPWPSSV